MNVDAGLRLEMAEVAWTGRCLMRRGNGLSEEGGDSSGVVGECPALGDLSVAEVVKLGHPAFEGLVAAHVVVAKWFGPDRMEELIQAKTARS